MQVLRAVLVLVFLCSLPTGARGFTSFGEESAVAYDRCRTVSITGQFRPEGPSQYHFSGDCNVSLSALRWNAQGAYSSKDGRTEERIVLNGHPPYRGEIRTRMVCDGDPWLEAVTCINMEIDAQNEMSSVTPLLTDMQREVETRKSPLTTGFPYNRKPLLAQREADLQVIAAKAEVEARLKAEAKQRRLAQGLAKRASLSAPTIETPATGQGFLNGLPVPIKLAPPAGLAATSYMVALQRKDLHGQWVDHGAISIGAAQAQSPTGYIGFGAGAPPTFLSAPGAWRLRVQVASPKPSAWSNWTEFTVLTPPSENSIEQGVTGAFR